MRRILALLFASALSAAAVPPAEVQAVRDLLREKRLTEATAASERLVTLHPDAAWAHAAVGLVRIAQDDGAGAVQALERARDLAPLDSEIHRALGDAYETAVDRAGMFAKLSLAKKCLAAYERAVELDPKNIAARQSVLGFHVGAPALFGGRRAKAWEQARAIQQLDAGEGHLAFGLLYAEDKDFARAAAEFDAALRLLPDNYLALYQTGRIAALTGQSIDRGIENLRQALDLPEPAHGPGHYGAHWRLGQLLEKQGHLSAARDSYQASLRLNPDFNPAAAALRKLE